ncbi:MAG: BCS1 N terminal-domain-containing protein [Linnemannia gamsii]|nr:MAG: BCS1 N terminal-domain-containing protein [Linnemannia gamsii]
MSHLHLGRISSAVAMVGMSGGASAVAISHPLLLATVARGATSAATAAAAVRGGSSPFFLNNGFTLGRNALVGGLALAGQRSFVSLPEGAQEVGKMVSSAADKMGLGDNQFAAGGFQLALIGGLLAGIRILGSHALEYFKRQVVVTAEFDSRDESYSWILNWLSDHPYSKKATQFSVSTTIARGAQKINGEGGDGAVAATYYLPAPGLHFFWFKNRLLWMYRERVRPTGATVATSGSPVENITISTLGRSRDLIQSLILEAQHKFIDRDKSRTVIFAADQYGNWRRTKSRPKRPLDTIVMDPKLKNYIVEDAKEFFASESWYSERGLPFRRGLLLYGSPGTGKTSFIHALAGELGLNIYVVNLSSKNLTDDTLSELVADTPSRCLLLIEDVDAAFIQRASKDAATGITFSGLLNSVDGVSAQEGRMLCMTTNHLERLDEALIRPGRVDVRAKFGKATQSQAEELFIKFFPQPVNTDPLSMSTTATTPLGRRASVDYKGDISSSLTISGDSTPLLSEKQPGSPSLSTSSPVPSSSSSPKTKEQIEQMAAQFSNVIPDKKFSIAQLQGFLMGYKKTPELAVKHANEFVRQAGSAEVSGTAKIGYDDGDDDEDKEEGDVAGEGKGLRDILLGGQ